MNPKVSVIILNWNGWEDTIECLESLYQINYPNFDVILVDNASEDDSIEKINKYCEGKINVDSDFFKYDQKNKPLKITEYIEAKIESKSNKKQINNLPSNRKLILIKNDKNYGFAEGNNIGMRYVLKSQDTDYILLLNNDTVVDKEFLNELVKVSENNEKIGFLGPKIYYYDFDGKKNVINFAGGKNYIFKGQTHHIGVNDTDKGQYDEIKEVDYVEGSCVLVRSKILKKVGLIDPSYFTYWEDIDWCIRGYKSGYSSIYVSKSKIWHKVSASSTNEKKIYYFTRNQFWFMKKNANNLQMLSFLLYFFGFYFWFTIIKSFINKDNNSTKYFLKGVIAGLNNKYH